MSLALPRRQIRVRRASARRTRFRGPALGLALGSLALALLAPARGAAQAPGDTARRDAARGGAAIRDGVHADWEATLAALARPDAAAPRAIPLVLVTAGDAPDSAWVAALLARGAIAGRCTRADPRVCTTERVGALVVRLHEPVGPAADDSTRVRLETRAYAECGGAPLQREATLVYPAPGTRPRVVRIALVGDPRAAEAAEACGPPRQE